MKNIPDVSDESHFRLCPHDYQRCVWRRSGQRADPAFTIARNMPSTRNCGLGAISFDTQTPLVVMSGALTAHRNVDDILRTVLLPFLLQYPGLIFQQDNAKPYTTRVAMNCLTAYQKTS
ncbi:transposable element Tc1 transposase [Trichonephila clavipes]|nr:transposable element Tc1 transposase [Trichonephila clavipes]